MTFKPLHILEYVLFASAGFFIRLLPLRYVHRTGFVLARIFYPLLLSRRKVALNNLRNAFPEMNDSTRKKIAFRSFQNISATFAELLWHKNLTKETIRQRVRIENPDLIKQVQAEKKGMIFLTAHFGSWELANQAVAVYTNSNMCVVAKQQSNLLVDRLLTRWRSLFGIEVVLMGIGVRKMLEALKKGEIVGLIADQSAPKESVAVEFFGRLVPTYEGPAVFSLRTGAPLILGCTVRQEDGNYKMQLTRVPCDDLHGASDENIRELTQRQVRMTEKIIRQYPEQWMWMHKRWKHVPDRAKAE
jgi:KDO2-lipid IV(A) lauroyltransferase